jgi:hypothetical protein
MTLNPENAFMTRMHVAATAAILLAACSDTPPASPDTPPAEEPGVAASHGSSGPTVFATGLIFPRGLEFGPDGGLYVAEAGSAGTTSTTPEQCAQVPAPIGPYRAGNTARISRIDRRGRVSTVVDGLPSALNGVGDILGVADVGFLNGTLYALVAGGGCSHGVPEMPASIVRIGKRGGWTVVANLSAFQQANPVDRPEADEEPDGSWYSMVQVGGGFVAVEPNHAEIDQVNVRSGQIRRLADLSGTLGKITPTTIVARRSALYFSHLGTFPGVAGSQKVYRLSRSGKIREVAGGFTMVLGLEFDRCGRMYVLETSTTDGFPTPGTGRVVRVDRRGERAVVVEGLFLPTAMTFGPDGALYISNKGFGPPQAGEILRVDVRGSQELRVGLDVEDDSD